MFGNVVKCLLDFMKITSYSYLCNKILKCKISIICWKQQKNQKAKINNLPKTVSKTFPYASIHRLTSIGITFNISLFQDNYSHSSEMFLNPFSPISCAYLLKAFCHFFFSNNYYPKHTWIAEFSRNEFLLIPKNINPSIIILITIN